MATDEREEEREFLEGLKGRTGRELAEWMAAVAAQGFKDKNEIIDWLRSEGFSFSRASWLERIHRNGGKPIHAANAPSTGQAGPDPVGLTPTHDRPVAVRPRLMVVPSTPPQPAPQPAFVPAPAKPIVEARPVAAPDRQAAATGADPQGGAMGSDPQGRTPVPPSKPAKKAGKPPPRVEAGDPAALEKLVATAKGYRPLYNFLEAQIRRAVPGAVFAVRDRYVSIGAPYELAAITLHPTEIRLGLDLGDHPFDGLVQKAKLRGPGPSISHMIVLTDARQVNSALLDLVKAASQRANAAG